MFFQQIDNFLGCSIIIFINQRKIVKFQASSLGNQYFRCIPCNTDLIFGKMGRSAIRQHLDSGRHRISINGSGTETISPSISLYQSSEEVYLILTQKITKFCNFRVNYSQLMGYKLLILFFQCSQSKLVDITFLIVNLSRNMLNGFRRLG